MMMLVLHPAERETNFLQFRLNERDVCTELEAIPTTVYSIPLDNLINRFKLCSWMVGIWKSVVDNDRTQLPKELTYLVGLVWAQTTTLETTVATTPSRVNCYSRPTIFSAVILLFSASLESTICTSTQAAFESSLPRETLCAYGIPLESNSLKENPSDSSADKWKYTS